MTRRFHGNFTRQPPIPGEGVERAVAVMRSGRLHRYDVVDGEAPETVLAVPAGNRTVRHGADAHEFGPCGARGESQ